MCAQWFGNIGKISLPTPFPVGDVNVYVVKGDKLTLFDAGINTKEGWDTFVFELSQLGYTPEDIEQIILTHHHPDHVGLLDYFSEDVDVFAHEGAERWTVRTDDFQQVCHDFYRKSFTQFGLPRDPEPVIRQMQAPLKFSCKGRSLTSYLKEGDRLPGLEEWLAIETPGHSQSHLVFYREKDGIMIVGDHVLATVSSNPLLEPPRKPDMERPKPQVQYNDSLKKVLQFPVEKAFTGHGTEVSKMHDLIDRRLGRQHERAMSVKEMLKDEPRTAFEVCKQLFPAIYKKQPDLTISESVGQLDYLLELGEITVHQNDNDILYFSAKRS
ncbi:glyoxylase-like metal-dependent hydrolase (beta-lactamase superfamily II) [Oikeobacillus pervagus]|uniref:Glyoxylase-like metal-dependent hydrolase (Beta-lactamase superfamily II) n=1 Tax=Oikeobacillus pervagus TaxID=1325931 RepID=A0AAJ1SW90_9BACI|nr:MBL fold metallo-hydrolase [Oikeobacillus pervagus]MDQ0213779.1 glyoxylase-like metal-dependent hydrolase (beta-lactamase superfamily II) [Oikeobacillus pervagus]